MGRGTGGLPVQAMQTYAIKSPVATHTRAASCREAGCAAFQRGWVTIVPEGPQADRVRALAATGLELPGVGWYRWRFSERPADGAPGLVEFTFPGGQLCFRFDQHRVSLDRPELFVVRKGDQRGNLGLIRSHGERGDLWVEDMQEHLHGVARTTGADR